MIIKEFDDSIYMDGMKIPDVVGRAPTKSEKEKARVGLIEKIMAGDIGTFYVQATKEIHDIQPLVYSTQDKVNNPKDDKKANQKKLLDKLRTILKRERRAFKDQDQEVHYNLSRLVRAIKLSPQAEKYLIADYNNNLNDYSRSPTIFEYMQSIIKMNSINPEALPIKQKKFFLNLITGIVSQNNHCPRDPIKPIDAWQPEEWTGSKKEIGDIQNKLKGCMLGKFVTELLQENISQNIEFADSILLCGISYLWGGNTNSQKNLIEEIGADKENRVMKNLQLLISKLGKFILKNIQESKRLDTNKDNAFSTTTIDNYDFFDPLKRYACRINVFEEETTDQELYSKTCMRTYRRAFKFLQLLCENNNIEGKNFIHLQTGVVKSIDFIQIAAKQIRNLFIALNEEVCGVTMFLLDFILEVTQIPVFENQKALMNLSFFEDVCALFNTFSKKENVSLKGFDGKEELIEQIYFKTIQIILSNFQGNDQKTFELIDTKLEAGFLTKILQNKLKSMKIQTKEDVIAYVDDNKQCVFDDNMMAVLSIIIIFQKLKEKLPESRIVGMYNSSREERVELFSYLEGCLLKIQIVNNGKNQIVIFPKYPVFNSLSDSLRDTVMDKVVRETHRDKIVSLLSYTGSIKRKIESSYSLLKKQRISQKNMNDAFTISACMSIVLCFYMMMYYDVIINYQQADYSSSRMIGLGRFALSLVQLSMSLVYGYFWLRFKIWQVPQKTALQPEKPAQEEQGSKTAIDRFIEKVASIMARLKIDVIITIVKDSIFTIVNILRGGDTNQPLFQSAQFYRMAMYVGVAFFGTFFHPALFFIHLMDIFCYIPEIGDIFKAIGLNIKQLAYVSFMGVVFTFVFCTVTFSNYQKNIYDSETPDEEMCQSMMECIMKLFVSGAIGESMEGFEIVRYSYDMIYFIFFEILFGNIISGIMLDSFGSLRERNNALVEDKENYCYICNISRETVEKSQKSFYDHIKGNHFLWNYVFFIYFLNAKPATDYSGLQYQITQQYNGKSQEEMLIDWVPINEEASFDAKAKLEELNGVVDEKLAMLQQGNTTIGDAVKEFKALAVGFVEA